MSNAVFQYNGNAVTFQLGNGDIMVNATEMAKPFGKRPVDYLRLPSTNELLGAITRKFGNVENQTVSTKVRKSHFDENQLVTTNQGGANPGTWMHEDIALDFAQWLSVDFKLWCNDRIKELMRHGMTATPDRLEEMLQNPDLLIGLASELKRERAEKERLMMTTKEQELVIKEIAPKAEYYDSVLQSDDLIQATIIAKEIGMSSATLNKKLHALGIQYYQGGTWLLYSTYQGMGFTKPKTHMYTGGDNRQHTKIHTYWTQKGREFIISLHKQGKL